MKKMFKPLLIIFLALLLIVLFLAAWVLWLFPLFNPEVSETGETEIGFEEIAEESENISFDSESGILYINNEIIVFFKEFATQEQINSLVDEFEAVIDNSMSDIGVYKFILSRAMTYEELEKIANDINSSSAVESAYINAVMELEGDAAAKEADFEYKDAVYPSDSWNGDTWDVTVPRGENWGMEAINAPGAWGYLDQMSTVKIGLIDSVPNASHEDLDIADSKVIFIDASTGSTGVNKYSLNADDHGTHVSGIMNAFWDNETGVSGVMGNKGEVYYSAVYYESDGAIEGRYATAYSYLLALKTLIDQDVQAINISQNTSRLVGFAASHGNQNAIEYLTLQATLTEKGLDRIISSRESAGKSDFVICVAAGNSNSTYYYKDDKQVYGYREKMTAWEIIKSLFGWRGEIGNSLALYNNFLNLMDEESVKSRVIVVGSVGIDNDNSTVNNTQYAYSYFSNIGERVDIVAPGEYIYSSVVSGYALLSGTSMATPHVTATAGLLFASNQNLTGPEVKKILLASTTGRYYYTGGYSGLLDAETAVINALKSRETKVDRVLNASANDGLDLCFVIDTTGSMGDDIDNAKENMGEIMQSLSEKTENYRVSLIDYRDYPSRTGASSDYPYRVRLNFTNSYSTIINAINSLDLGNGGDTEETVYSALMAAVKLNWRSDAKKVIIILGDAAPLDPEPVTGYTYEDVLMALYSADISLDYEDSDSRVTDSFDESMINVFSIGTSASDSAEDFFREISESTGGNYVSVDNASDVSDAIKESIEKIEVVDKADVYVDFGADMANERICLYSEDGFMFAFETNEDGQFTIDDIEAGSYRWTCNGIYIGGTLSIEKDKHSAVASVSREYWFTPLLRYWNNNTTYIVLTFIGIFAVCVLIPMLMLILRKKKKQGKAKDKNKDKVKTIKDKDKDKSKHISGSDGQRCPICNQSIKDDSAFCPECGSKIPRCPTCGKVIFKYGRFCPNDGTEISEEILALLPDSSTDAVATPVKTE